MIRGALLPREIVAKKNLSEQRKKVTGSLLSELLLDLPDNMQPTAVTDRGRALAVSGPRSIRSLSPDRHRYGGGQHVSGEGPRI